MKQAVIDIGSNSMRLTVYDISNEHFKILFREKDMAALAGYVENNILTQDGINRACVGLLDFKHTLKSLKINDVYVFATASLRNIANTDEAIRIIKEKTDYNIDVISGKLEALLGYYGALQSLSLKDGAFIDIGGASTEVVTFQNNDILSTNSFPLGSLSLYKKCVRYILPDKESIKKINQIIKKTIKLPGVTKTKTIVAVGGTARGILKLAKKYYGLDASEQKLTAKQFQDLSLLLLKKDSNCASLILKIEPERIHTIIPGYMILKYLFDSFGADELIVSNYGVREGYLCQKRLPNNIHIHKTEN